MRCVFMMDGQLGRGVGEGLDSSVLLAACRLPPVAETDEEADDARECLPSMPAASRQRVA